MEKKLNLLGIVMFLLVALIGIFVNFETVNENVWINWIFGIIGVIGAVWCFLSITGSGILAFIKTPGKIGVKIAAYKAARQNAKLDKAVWKAYKKITIENSLKNPEFRNDEKVNKIYSKLNYIDAKKSLKNSKKNLKK